MPWSSQGGGPWGSGKGPWDSGPQSSGPTPPDLEELLRRSQDKLRRVLPGGSFGGRGAALILLGVLALWGFSGFFRVEPRRAAIRQIRPRCAARAQLSHTVSDRVRAHPEGVAREQDRRRHA